MQHAVGIEIDLPRRSLLDEQHAEGEEQAEDDAHRGSGIDAAVAAHHLDEQHRRQPRDRGAREHRKRAAGRGDQERDHETRQHAVADRVAHEAQAPQQEEVPEQSARRGGEGRRHERKEVDAPC